MEEHTIPHSTHHPTRRRPHYSRARYTQPDRRCVSVERRGRGFAVHAPDFYVWDREGDRAIAWASELQATLGSKSSGERE